MTTMVRRTRAEVARPLKILVPLIQDELTAGDRAGLEHYRRAGEMLLEAKEQMPYGGWGKWLAKNFHLGQDQARRYMRLAERMQGDEQTDSARRAESIRSVIGERDTSTSAHASWRPVLQAARDLDAELFAKERQTADEEVRLHRELATELVDLGYRALATRLHPDRGGSKDAMTRLNRVRDELKSVATTRRFV